MIKVGSGLTLLIGGARSGKSDIAVRLGQSWVGPVVFVATATAGDQDMVNRIARHQLDRPTEWQLVEDPLFGAHAVADLDPAALVIIDCVTLLVANMLFTDTSATDLDRDNEIVEQIAALTESLDARTAPTVVISNEVGLGVHPETPLGRRYRDLLGRANRRFVDRAETPLFIVGGRAVELQEIDTSW